MIRVWVGEECRFLKNREELLEVIREFSADVAEKTEQIFESLEEERDYFEQMYRAKEY